MAQLTISILLLCWNHSRYLEQCIEALARQSNRDFETVFLDNASVDGSCELAMGLFGRFGLSATVIRNQTPASIPANLNRLLAASSGENVAVLSTDDWYDQQYVEAMLACVDDVPDAGWYSCSGWLFFEEGQRSQPIDDTVFVTDRPAMTVFLAGAEPHFHVGCVYRRAALNAIGGWDEGQLIEDRDLFLRLSRNFEHARTRQRLVHYRQTRSSASANVPFMLEGWKRFYAKHGKSFGTSLRARQGATYRAASASLVDQGKLREAVPVLAQALKLAPLSPQAWRTALYLVRSSVRK